MKSKAAPNRMQVNIQKNTSEYNPAADTPIMEYIRNEMWTVETVLWLKLQGSGLEDDVKILHPDKIKEELLSAPFYRSWIPVKLLLNAFTT